MKEEIPFKEGTQIYKIFKVLSDLKWHCSECELPGSQPAKALQMIRQAGYEMEKVSSNWEKRILCPKCNRKTPHRRLVSLKRKAVSIERSGVSPKLKARIIKFFKGRDAILGYEPTGRSIEVDHRIPQVRWKVKEVKYDTDMGEGEIKKNFMLLTRENNLLKSRNCEECEKTGKRQIFFGIDFFYEGNENYDKKLGCVGCGWYNPEEWRKKLNKVLKK